MQNQESDRAASPEDNGKVESDGHSITSIVILAYLILNAYIALSTAPDVLYWLAYVLSYFTLFLVVFWALNSYHRLPDGLPKKQRFKFLLQGLLILANIGFLYPFEVFFGPGWAWAIWALVGGSSLVVFYAIFLYPEMDVEEETLPV